MRMQQGVNVVWEYLIDSRFVTFRMNIPDHTKVLWVIIEPTGNNDPYAVIGRLYYSIENPSAGSPWNSRN